MNLPNKLTVLRVLMIPLFLACMLMQFQYHYLWALILFALASFTDLLDGKIARARGLVTDFGKLMDPLADKLLVMSAMICLIPAGTAPVLVVVVILAREFIVTSIRLVAAGKGSVLAADIWGKIKTVFQMVWICYDLLLLFLLADGPFHGSLPMGTLQMFHRILLGGSLLFTVISGINYTVKNRHLFADA